MVCQLFPVQSSMLASPPHRQNFPLPFYLKLPSLKSPNQINAPKYSEKRTIVSKSETLIQKLGTMNVDI